MQLITALATPFENGKIHILSYLKLLERQKAADGILCVGTTAESGMLSPKEKKLLIRTARTMLPNKKIWVGIGGDTASAIKEGLFAKRNGADGLMITPPSFFKCTKEGFVQHVSAICAQTQLPIMLYNAPSRCCYTLWQDAVEMLSDKGICMKDAGSDLNYARALAPKLPIFCGNEELLRQFCDVGAVGVVSVVSNVAPNLTKHVMQIFENQRKSTKERAEELCEKCGKANCDCHAGHKKHQECDNEKSKKKFTNDIGRRQEVDEKCKKSKNNFENDIGIGNKICNTATAMDKKNIDDYQMLAKLAFCELNPIPIKYMLYKEGVFSTFDMRLPLTSASTETQKLIDEFWQINFER